MRLANNAPSVWPGYVAAVASLVLSLLLLLAILVFALTQIGNLVSRFRAEILRGLLQAESQTRPASPAPALAPTVRVAPVPPEPLANKAATNSAKPAQRQIKLIFGNGLADIPASHRSVVANAIENAQHAKDLAWQIRATVLPHDPIMERATYQLMLSVRQALVAQAYYEKRISLHLDRSYEAPPGYSLGEVVIYLLPVETKANDGGTP